jgi:5-methylcytosine-specific restriction endonuclease McrA
MKRPCLTCGVPTQTTRCEACAKRFNKERAPFRQPKGRGYDNEYRKQAAAVRANARICWICGQGRKQDDPWQADHLIPLADGGLRSPLAAAHRSCNIRRSNRLKALNGSRAKGNRHTA